MILCIVHACTVGAALLFVTGSLARADEATPSKEALENRAQVFVKGYERSLSSGFPKMAESMALEVAKIAECDEAATKALVDGAKALGKGYMELMRVLYHDYFMAHYERVSQSDFWDDYAKQLSSPRKLEGNAKLNADWDELLGKTLSLTQLGKWQTELPNRKARFEKAQRSTIETRIAKENNDTREVFSKLAANLSKSAGITDDNRLAPAVEVAVRTRMDIVKPEVETVVPLLNKLFTAYSETCLTKLEKRELSSFLTCSNASTKAGQAAFEAETAKLFSDSEKAKLTEVKKKRAERIEESVKVVVEMSWQNDDSNFAGSLSARAARLAEAVGFDEARRKKFDARVVALDKEAETVWRNVYSKECRTRMTEMLLPMTEEEEKERLKQIETGRFGFDPDKATRTLAKKRENQWKSLLTETLSSEERAKWDDRQKMLVDQRARMFAEIGVSELDRQIYLLPSQRETLEKLALEAARPLAALPGELLTLWQENTSGAMCVFHAVGLPKVEAVLDADQKKRFTELMNDGSARYVWDNLKNQLHQ